MGGKVCKKCYEWKLYIDYPKGKTCKDGHEGTCKKCVSERRKQYSKDNKEKIAEYQKRYRKENKEKIADQTRQWHEENKERTIERMRRWREKNKEKVVEYGREWREQNKSHISQKTKLWKRENKDKVYASILKRRSNKNFVKFTPVQRTELLERDNWSCQCCGKKVHDDNKNDENKAHIDHIIPISKGGDSTPENLRVLCRTCNLSKRNKTEIEIDDVGQVKLSI